MQNLFRQADVQPPNLIMYTKYIYTKIGSQKHVRS